MFIILFQVKKMFFNYNNPDATIIFLFNIYNTFHYYSILNTIQCKGFIVEWQELNVCIHIILLSIFRIISECNFFFFSLLIQILARCDL